jgi:hypothetical protein
MDSRLRGNDRRECPPEADRESEGVPQIFFLMSPKIEDPPQEEWGIKGVEEGFQ